MNVSAQDDASTHYTVREVVGVFHASGALQTAVEQLGLAGVDRAAISVLRLSTERTGEAGELRRPAATIEDDPAAGRAAFVSDASRVEAEIVAVAVPLEIGGFAGAWAVAAAGGALVAAIGATALGAGIGAGLGVLLFRTVARRHASNIQSQLAAGGLVLWVRTPDGAAEQRAIDVLRHCGGTSVHAHSVAQEWGVADVPLHDAQPDPFLEHDKA